METTHVTVIYVGSLRTPPKATGKRGDRNRSKAARAQAGTLPWARSPLKGASYKGRDFVTTQQAAPLCSNSTSGAKAEGRPRGQPQPQVGGETARRTKNYQSLSGEWPRRKFVFVKLSWGRPAYLSTSSTNTLSISSSEAAREAPTPRPSSAAF